MTEEDDRAAKAKAAIQSAKTAREEAEVQRLKSEDWAKERAAKHAAKIRDVGMPTLREMEAILAESGVTGKIASSDQNPMSVSLQWPSVFNPEVTCLLKLTTEGGMRVDSEFGPRTSSKANASDKSDADISKMLWDRFQELLERKR